MALTRFTIRQLEAFVAVAQARSFVGATDGMGLTAQAVSQLVAELEGVLGFRLFDRTTRRVALSSAGRDFLASAESVLRHVRDAEGTADDVRHRAAGVVRVGAPLVLASTALPAAVRAYQQTRPRVVVRIRDLPIDGLVEAVAAGDVDLAIAPDRPVGEDILRTSLFKSRWVLWCAADHPLAKRQMLRWADLRHEHLVAAGREHERGVAMMQSTLPEGERVIPVDIVDNVATAVGIAAQGLAATLSPAYVGVIARPFGLVMRRVIEPETVRIICLYRPAHRALLPAAEGFAEHLGEFMPRWAARIQRRSPVARVHPS